MAPWSLAALRLEQLDPTDRVNGDGGQQIAEPAGSRGVEGKDAAAGAARQVEEDLAIPRSDPVRAFLGISIDLPKPLERLGVAIRSPGGLIFSHSTD
jgi:hypothetical protein